jgi:threonine-phosphate decarboxylase
MNIYDYAERKKLSIRQIMDFTTAVNPLGPSNKAKNVLRKNIRHIDIFPDSKLRYLAGLIQKRAGVKSENILFGHGSTELLRVILRTEHIETVLVPSPVSGYYEQTISSNKLALKRFPLDPKNNFLIDPGKILDGAKKANAILIPYPHDVIGTAPGMDDLIKLIVETDRLGKVLILDESYRDFTTLESPVQKVIRSKKTIIIRTFTLFYAMAGLPFGYAIGPADMIEKIGGQVFPEEISALAMNAAIASIKDSFYAVRTREFIKTEKDYLLKAIALLEGVACVDTPCPFIILSFDKRPESLKDIFLRYRILIDEFIDEEGNFYLRLPVKKHKWNARFIRTLRNAMNTNKQ